MWSGFTGILAVTQDNGTLDKPLNTYADPNGN
jgi:hypothetical protein